MRLVVDTNVVISALLWGGVPRQLLDAIHQGRASAFASSELIREFREVLAREKFAASIQALRAASHECHFWRTHTGAELDLLVVRRRRRIGIEVKRTTAPTVTASMRSALTDFKLTEFYVVHAGNATFPLSREIRAVAFRELLGTLEPLR